jgi:hypothetical protein
MAKKPTLKINREAFIEWFFDYDICKDFVHNYGILSELKNEGTFTITAEEILDGAGYLPSNLAEEGQDVILNDQDEIDTDAYDKIIFS